MPNGIQNSFLDCFELRPRKDVKHESNSHCEGEAGSNPAPFPIEAISKGQSFFMIFCKNLLFETLPKI